MAEAIGILVDSEIDVSTRHGKTRVFINKTLSTETAYQQGLIVGKLRCLFSPHQVNHGGWCPEASPASQSVQVPHDVS
jgi:hypothetical protein